MLDLIFVLVIIVLVIAGAKLFKKLRLSPNHTICKSFMCGNIILKITAEVNNGICMPCKIAQENKEKTFEVEYEGIIKSVDDLLVIDKDELLLKMMTHRLDFRNGLELRGFANDLRVMDNHIPYNGTEAYLCHVNKDFVKQSLSTLKQLKSQNFQILKNILKKVPCSRDGEFILDQYDETEDWANWDRNHAELLINHIRQNIEKYT